MGKFPAHTAAREGNVQLLSMLIKEGHCGINDKDQQGATPAHKGELVTMLAKQVIITVWDQYCCCCCCCCCCCSHKELFFFFFFFFFFMRSNQISVQREV